MTSSNSDTYSLDDRPTSRALSIALLRTREHIMEPIRPLLAEIGMTEQKWRILRILAENGPMDQTAISREACLLLSSVTRILKSMETDGHVVRIQNDDDRRSKIVRISSAARELIEKHHPASVAVYGRLRTEFGEDKLERLLDLLEEVQAIDL